MSATLELGEDRPTAQVDYLSRSDVSIPGYPSQAYSLRSSFSRPDYVTRDDAENADETVPPPKWLQPAASRLASLMRLKVGWDGGAAPPVSRDLALQALVLLGRISTSVSPCPWIVPLASGGVQMEWHGTGLTVEVAIDPVNGNEVYIRGDEEEFEAPLEAAVLPKLRSAVARLSV